jgi:hypothetical protein
MSTVPADRIGWLRARRGRIAFAVALAAAAVSSPYNCAHDVRCIPIGVDFK